jgi:hypothetical protein
MSCYPGWCGLASDLRSLDTRIESLSGEIEELAKQDATPGGLAFLAALDSVPELDSFDRVFKCLLQNTLADGADHEAEQPAPKVLAIADDDNVNVGSPVGVTREVVGVARRASP